MNSRMTFLTNRLDIEPVFRLIAPVMIFYGLFVALALNSCRMGQDSLFYGLFNSAVGLVLLFGCIIMQPGIFAALLACFVSIPTKLGDFLVISFVSSELSSRGMFVLSCLLEMACFTVLGISVCVGRLLVKHRKWLGFGAFVACSMRYIRWFFIFPLSIFRLCSYIATLFAQTTQAVLAAIIFVKFRCGFNCLALWTSFRYDVLSHIRFLSKRVWLEPMGSMVLPIGLSYSTRDNESCQRKIGGNLCRYTP